MAVPSGLAGCSPLLLIGAWLIGALLFQPAATD